MTDMTADEYQSSGYDDSNFHVNVIPKIECPECGRTSADDYKPLSTKYPDGVQI